MYSDRSDDAPSGNLGCQDRSMAVTEAFTWTALPSRVVFGRVRLQSFATRSRGSSEPRVLLVGGGASTRAAFERAREALGDLVAGVVGGSTQHVPAMSSSGGRDRAGGRARTCS